MQTGVLLKAPALPPGAEKQCRRKKSPLDRRGRVGFFQFWIAFTGLTRLRAQAAWMFDACLPFGPWVTSNDTFWPSLRVLNPPIWIGRKMREQIFAAIIRRNEAITFCVVEPFHSACCHIHSAFIKKAVGNSRKLFEFQGSHTGIPMLRKSLKPNTRFAF